MELHPLEYSYDTDPAQISSVRTEVVLRGPCDALDRAYEAGEPLQVAIPHFEEWGSRRALVVLRQPVDIQDETGQIRYALLGIDS